MHYEPEAMGCRVVRISFKSLSLMMWLELMNPLSVVALASSMLSGRASSAPLFAQAVATHQGTVSPARMHLCELAGTDH